MRDADCADNIAHQANTPAQAETLQLSLERAAAGIGLHVNADKTEYMCFNQRGNIFTLECGPLKIVDKFTILRSSVSSTRNKQKYGELSVILKSDLPYKIKRSFFSKQRSCR